MRMILNTITSIQPIPQHAERSTWNVVALCMHYSADTTYCVALMRHTISSGIHTMNDAMQQDSNHTVQYGLSH